jgi:proteasome lid subunit RPN8/RPN11
MVRHAEACLPEEACGFLGGRNGRIVVVLPVENVEHSPVRFRMDPHGQLRGMQQLEAKGLDLLGIYHSHPLGPPGLSTTDIAEAAYPETALVVLSPAADAWIGRAFLVEEGFAEEVRFVVEADTGAAPKASNRGAIS